MAKVLVLYYSTYGHIETMAYAVAEGARAAGATVDVKRVPETVPEATAKAAHFKLDHRRRSRRLANLRTTTRSLSAPRRGLAECLRRWGASGSRRAPYG